ncbi:RES family NAD+ phosphorylase, partial [Burkholderia cepacia]|uniref:RES family NAD+ phosphorylase n=1 Tax=Burkholderia cepacia TaxID=292 RepID=UPI00157B6F8D
VRLAQDGDHLFFGKPALLHDFLFSVGSHSLKFQLVRKFQGRSGVKLEDITGDSYTKTHELGDMAIREGYDGILAPSARNPDGANLISFAGW